MSPSATSPKPAISSSTLLAMTAVRTDRCVRRRASVYARSESTRESACCCIQSVNR
ncbi:Uncharacterised protein [Mycobacterium tuberculosis]|uniref:Uncharacterized protein n=1 Tax=Mycobacterium tuberculosis TaxID=1773 RepID=A0A916LBH5_MYCTX|nr:Uncharacterised protein [Mycobacterium tuberculosis]COX79757.1 Uncharacterised protein [Mycobacterium tuberculosis]COY39029.1 Uncharacterised protein [Mycobacterium tuberculosis]